MRKTVDVGNSVNLGLYVLGKKIVVCQVIQRNVIIKIVLIYNAKKPILNIVNVD